MLRLIENAFFEFGTHERDERGVKNSAQNLVQNMLFCMVKCHTMRKCRDLKNDVCRCRGLVTVGAAHEMIQTYITEDMASLLALVFEINFQKVSDPLLRYHIYKRK